MNFFFPSTASHAISPIVCKSSAQTKNEKAPTQTLTLSHLCAPESPDRSEPETRDWRQTSERCDATQSARRPQRKQSNQDIIPE